MIYFCGDVHGHFEHLRRLARERPPHAFILLGDVQPLRPLAEELAPIRAAGIPVWWIVGNHDSDPGPYWDNLQGDAQWRLDGRVETIAGVRVGGLGGIFRGQVWYPDPGHEAGPDPIHVSPADLDAHLADKAPQHRQQMRHCHQTSIFWADYEALWDQRADILVTHEAPSCHPHGFTAIDELAQSMGVAAVFHGHHHDSLDYGARQASLGFRAHGVGFHGVMDEAGNTLLAGVFDEDRKHRL